MTNPYDRIRNAMIDPYNRDLVFLLRLIRDLDHGTERRDEDILMAFRAWGGAGMGLRCQVLHHRPHLVSDLLRNWIDELLTFDCCYTASDVFAHVDKTLAWYRNPDLDTVAPLSEDGERFLMGSFRNMGDLLNQMIADAWRGNWEDELDPARFEAHQRSLLALEATLADHPEELARQKRQLNEEFDEIYFHE